jgi:hypothetical protein
MRMLRGATVLAVTTVVAGCGGGGGAGSIAGDWTRSMSGEGDVTLRVESGGRATMELPAPRWPEATDWSAKLTVAGDSLAISEESGPAACGKPAPTYVVKVEGKAMTIGGGGSDPCGARHAALVGSWTKS